MAGEDSKACCLRERSSGSTVWAMSRTTAARHRLTRLAFHFSTLAWASGLFRLLVGHARVIGRTGCEGEREANERDVGSHPEGRRGLHREPSWKVGLFSGIEHDPKNNAAILLHFLWTLPVLLPRFPPNPNANQLRDIVLPRAAYKPCA